MTLAEGLPGTANAGAAAVVIHNNQTGVLDGTQGNGLTRDTPVTCVTQGIGQHLAVTPGLVMRARTDTFRGLATTSSTFAGTRGYDPDNVVWSGPTWIR